MRALQYRFVSATLTQSEAPAKHSRGFLRYDDRIAQLVLEPVTRADVVEPDELSSTDRGVAGLRSTGV